MSSLQSERNQDHRRFSIKSEQAEESAVESRFGLPSSETSGPVRTVEQRQEALEEFDRETNEFGSVSKSLESQYIENAILLIQNGDAELARNLLAKVLHENEDHLVALRWLGQTYVVTQEYAEAEECFRALIEKETSSDHMVDLADVLYAQGQDDEALVVYQEALDATSENSELLFNIYKNIGNIYVRAGDFAGAEENYNRAYTLNPDSDVLLVNYGTLEIQRQELGTAVRRFRQAVDINPQNDRAWLGLALVHREFGDHELAWANLEEALSINVANEVALNLCVDWGLKDNKDNLVIRYLEKYLEQEGHNNQRKMLLARILFMDQRVRRATMVLEEILHDDPDHKEALELVNEICAQQSALDEESALD